MQGEISRISYRRPCGAAPLHNLKQVYKQTVRGLILKILNRL